MDLHKESIATTTNPQTETAKSSHPSSPTELRAEIDRLSCELAAAQQERSQSAAYGLELLNDKEKIQQKYESIETLHQQSLRELQDLREAYSKAVNNQRVSATTVFENEVQLLNESDALEASFTHAKQEIEKELKQTKSQMDSVIAEKDRYQNERDELAKKVMTLEQDRKSLKAELKELKNRETKLFSENGDLEEENVSLQKQVSNLRSTQVEFESSKHEIQRLQDEVAALKEELEKVITLRHITERQMQEALEALQSEREQKYALRQELDKRNSADPLINWTSLAAFRGSPHLANLALRGFSSPHRSSLRRDPDLDSPNGFVDQDTGTTYSESDNQSHDIIHDLEMPSIEGSLFDEVHLTEIRKLQQDLEEKENQRSNLNTKLIDIQHKLESKSRQADEIEKKLETICSLVEDMYNEFEQQKNSPTAVSRAVDSNKQQVAETAEIVVTSTTNNEEMKAPKLNVLDDFENIHSHLQILFAEFKVFQEVATNAKLGTPIKNKDISQTTDLSLIERAISDGDKKISETLETLNSDDVQSLRAMLYKKHEQLRQLRTILKSNKDSAEVALENLKSKYNMEKAVYAETMTKLRLEHKRLSEDAATFASLRSHMSARIVEYNTEIEKLQSKLAASEQEKNTLNSILRMAIEQKVMLTQKLEALEMDKEDPQPVNNNNRNANGQPRSGVMRGRGSVNRNSRPPRTTRPSGCERR